MKSSIFNGAITSLVIAATTLTSCIMKEESEFDKVNNSKEWTLKLDDSCTGNWQDNWFLDGLIATVENSEEGMNFKAGEEYGNDAHHAVLWTKESYEGDVKIEYNYTRTDTTTVNVNILYIQAQGIGTGEYDKDISKWNHLREVPHMWIYYKYMDPLHISYAAFPMVNDDPKNDYLRVRKYPIDEHISFDQMEVEPTFFNIELFKPFVTYKVTVIKSAGKLYMDVKGDDRAECYIWDISDKAQINYGRIGLRHMYTRASRYSDFKIYTK